jgi:RimJ/RimL family protein N-acetyltransferase
MVDGAPEACAPPMIAPRPRLAMTFYPDDAPVPAGLRSDELLLRPLRATDVELDYEAVMATQEVLRRGSGGAWPRPDFTLEENLADLQGHEADFLARRGFTYTVMDPTESRCLGCVYAYPPKDDRDGQAVAHEAVVWFWVRPDCVADDLDRRLVAALVPWLRNDFAFARVLFRAWADDERQIAVLGEAGLRVVDARPIRGKEALLFG